MCLHHPKYLQQCLKPEKSFILFRVMLRFIQLFGPLTSGRESRCEEGSQQTWLDINEAYKHYLICEHDACSSSERISLEMLFLPWKQLPYVRLIKYFLSVTEGHLVTRTTHCAISRLQIWCMIYILYVFGYILSGLCSDYVERTFVPTSTPTPVWLVSVQRREMRGRLLILCFFCHE